VRGFDPDYITNTLITLAQTPTDVPLGQNEIEPTDPKVPGDPDGHVWPPDRKTS
jgi:hypothetical protein